MYHIAGWMVMFFLLTLLFSTSIVSCLITCESFFSPVHPVCLSLPCCPEKSVSVLLDLPFQFITQPPFTMTHASCQSLWPVWEPATAVQSFTYWTMVRGGMSHGCRPLHTNTCLCLCLFYLLFNFNVLCRRWWCNKWGNEDDLVFRAGGWLDVCTLHASSASTLWATLVGRHYMHMYINAGK